MLMELSTSAALEYNRKWHQHEVDNTQADQQMINTDSHKPKSTHLLTECDGRGYLFAVFTTVLSEVCVH